MESYSSLGSADPGIPLLADEVSEFHLARLLILFQQGCGGTIRGLTKMAKMDFFLRYPEFFERVTHSAGPSGRARESAMVRHLYGPWDHRYYTLLNALVSRGLLEYSKEGRTYVMSLTPSGNEAARVLAAEVEYVELSIAAGAIGEALGSMTGTALKNMIYSAFSEEVGNLKLGDSIG